MGKALLLSKVDREDYWVSGFVFIVEDHQHYEDDFNEIKPQLLTPEFQQRLIEKFCLEDDLFEGDLTYKLVDVYWHYRANFVFRNEDGKEVEFSLAPDHVDVWGSNNGVNADQKGRAES